VLARFVQRGPTQREGPPVPGGRGARPGLFPGGQGRGKGRPGPGIEGQWNQSRNDPGIVQQDPNAAAGSVNMVERRVETVDTIAGGFASGGSLSSSRKRHYRSVNYVQYFPPRSQPPITLSDEDFSSHDPKQDDPVVVTATIANWRVHKDLIDQRSSTDVLY